MVRAEAAARRHGKTAACPLENERHRFVDDVVEIEFLLPGPAALVPVAFRPALLVDGIDHEILDLSLLKILAQLTDHAELLIVVTEGVLGRERQERHAAVAVDHHMHVSFEAVAVLCNFFSVHTKSPLE